LIANPANSGSVVVAVYVGEESSSSESTRAISSSIPRVRRIIRGGCVSAGVKGLRCSTLVDSGGDSREGPLGVETEVVAEGTGLLGFAGIPEGKEARGGGGKEKHMCERKEEV
jgi:hypothetical protein